MAAGVKRLLFALALLLSGCAVRTTPPIERIALLAPFEGQYREIGYQTLYAARLALADADALHTELLAIDDGGSPATAQNRARAIEADPLIIAVLVAGPNTADLTFAEGIPVYPIGDWQPVTVNDITTADINVLTDIGDAFTCNDLCQLRAFAALAADPTAVTIESSAPPVTATFRERYLNSDIFVPQPLPIAALAYDITAQALHRETPNRTASRNRYTYTDDGALIPND